MIKAKPPKPSQPSPLLIEEVFIEVDPPKPKTTPRLGDVCNIDIEDEALA